MQTIALRGKGVRYPYRAIKRFEVVRADYDENDNDNYSGGGSIVITEQAQKAPEFTGIITPDEMPIFRFYMPKPGIGFLVEDLGEYEPEAFMYGISQEYGLGEDADDDSEQDD